MFHIFYFSMGALAAVQWAQWPVQARRDGQTIAEGHNSFLHKHDSISRCIKTWKMSVVFMHP